MNTNHTNKALLDFWRKYDVKAEYPAAYNLLDFYFYDSSSYFVDMAEAINIRKAVVALKDVMCPDSYEKIFISHREKDKKGKT